MIYKDLKFPEISGRPFFYADFVQTVDGKTQILKDTKGYWPLGSEMDFSTFKGLRAHADVLIHGKETAKWARTVDNLGKGDVQDKRKELEKMNDILYLVLSSHPDLDLLKHLKNPAPRVQVLLVTTEEAIIPKEYLNEVKILKLGQNDVDLDMLSDYLYKEGYKDVLVEGGAHTFAEFLKADLIDELFLTIAPKIVGNSPDSTLTLVEGTLFPPEKVKKLKLISVMDFEDEIYLRYGIE